ncbi:MAG: DUF262 domain-containing protein [Drouetiella hepatica Uher 2000/2452]|jgi:hypothetical protein|uniref:DUF262 domain-containing protein n=1 Tax=Drouetiella hepatica Uher 2000/2452 TaxID=904376 RepID=A0A951UPD2_9CYAN|nr:DUF262 domain-containing protein [Drouetiella hepatica Uher 2000/2452]
MTNPITTYDLSKEALLDLLRGIEQGRIQLPDFQRNWVWDDTQVRGLLGSISLAYPVGVVILLQLGNPKVRFKPRLPEGVHIEPPPQPTLLILDGQQRLTTLFQTLLAEQPVATRDSLSKKPLRRWYYIDIDKALDYPPTDREEAILGLSEDRTLRQNGSKVIDCSSPEQEYKLGLFPVSKIFQYSEWRSKYSCYWHYNSEKLQRLDRFEAEVIKCFDHYQVPLIRLRQELPKEAVCQVFEKVNSSGKDLTLFDLITAAYAADNFSLRDDWATRQRRLQRQPILKVVDNTDFLQAVTLVAMQQRRLQASLEPAGTKVIPARYSRSHVLSLSLHEYKTWAEPITKGFEEAARLLHGQKIFDARDLPYAAQIMALATFFTVLGDCTNNEQVRAKLIRWFWCGLFGEMYGGASHYKAMRDLAEVPHWIKGGAEPTTLLESNFVPARLLRLRNRQSAAFRGLCVLLLQQGARDFSSGETITDAKYFHERIDSHHIFPQAWCRAHGIDDKLSNSIVNKALISARTNNEIGSRPPSQYLHLIEQKGMTRSRLDGILRSHLIDPTTMRADDFRTFFQRRTSALLNLIAQAIGKPIVQDVLSEPQADLPDAAWVEDIAQVTATSGHKLTPTFNTNGQSPSS